MNKNSFKDRQEFNEWFTNAYPDWTIKSRLWASSIFYKDDDVFMVDDHDKALHISAGNSFYEAMSCKVKFMRFIELADKKFKTAIAKLVKNYLSHIEVTKKIPAIKTMTDNLSVMCEATGRSMDELLCKGKKVVEIKWDSSKHKLRAKHGDKWVVFPTHLRVANTKYLVDDLIEKNGCYRPIGNIELLGGDIIQS